MKKLVFVAAAFVAFAVPAFVSAAPHVTSTVTLDFVGDQYGGVFFGDVNSSKDQCKANRKVVVKETDAYGGDKVGSDFTNDDGEYFVQDESVESAQYVATATKKKVKKHNGDVKFICTKKLSNVITAP